MTLNTNNVNLNMPNLSDTEEQTISNIKNLQQIENDLYNTLENNLNNNMLSPEQQENIINKINEVSTMRINLFDSLTSSYSFYQTNVATSRNVLNNQVTALKIANEHLNTLKARMENIINKNTNKRRLIQINTYYGKQYDAYSQVMKYVLFLCIPILILSILSNKGIVPENIYNVLVIIILAIGFIIIIRKLWDISLRDNMNFDEYNWKFDPTFKPGSGSSSSDTNTSVNESPCIGALCCSENQIFDEENNVCVPIPVSSSYVAQDVGTIFGSQSVGKSKFDICNITT